MSKPVLLVEKKEQIALVTLNRPESMNALSTELRNTIADAFSDLRNDPSIRVAILKGVASTGENPVSYRVAIAETTNAERRLLDPRVPVLEKLLGRTALDRTAVILDIFAQNASSQEGKAQVELAQLRHISTRLVRGWTHLERQKGGIGLRGPGSFVELTQKSDNNNNSANFSEPSVCLLARTTAMLLEAASVRTPIICSDIPENKVIFDDQEVLYFKSEDREDLADNIEWAALNNDLMEEKAAKAYEKVLEVFTYEKISMAYQRLFNSLLK